jgi:hypothetical protein
VCHFSLKKLSILFNFTVVVTKKGHILRQKDLPFSTFAVVTAKITKWGENDTLRAS